MSGQETVVLIFLCFSFFKLALELFWNFNDFHKEDGLNNRKITL